MTQIIGYQKDANGSWDYSRPIYATTPVAPQPAPAPAIPSAGANPMQSFVQHQVATGATPAAPAPAPAQQPQSPYDYNQYSIAPNPNPQTGGRDIAFDGQVQTYDQMKDKFGAGFDVSQIKNVYNPPSQQPQPTAYDNYIAQLKSMEERLGKAQSAYAQTSVPTEDELSTEKQLNDLIASGYMGEAKAGDQPIAMPFITGQQAAIQRQVGYQSMPLKSKLGYLQSKRQAATDVKKSELEYETGKASRELAPYQSRYEQELKSNAPLTLAQKQDQANIDRKFEEDKRQYGLDYALKEKQLAKARGGAGTDDKDITKKGAITSGEAKDWILKEKRANLDIPYYDLWGQLADELKKQGLNPDNYDKEFWEILHPEGLAGYKKYNAPKTERTL